MESARLCPATIAASIEQLRGLLARRGVDDQRLEHAAEAARLVGELTGDGTLACAVIAAAALDAGIGPGELAPLVGEDTAQLADELARFAQVGAGQQWSPERSLAPAQAEALRKMLLAVVSDPRLVLARLAVQLVQLRAAKLGAEVVRRQLALEARAIFAPLASRLGVWQLKWELEDLAFRYLEPEAYHRIAAALNERRADRERYIEALCHELDTLLARARVHAQVYGRPKHIFSIHRKMQRKDLAFGQLFDVRAVRIVVDSIPDCYAALGVVHGRWPFIPGEFDDYIATPKDNDYRSIHTAVVGPEGKPVEVQIRTREMHEQAELGVAAHWRYKEGGTRDAGYERKIEWVRRLLEPGDGGVEDDFLERVRGELFEDRVYALTPKGEVVDLPRGATPLDFAYHVHTELGHRCRGAKVDGRIVPLTRPLENGEVVEIITSRTGSPSRDWLAPEQGFLVSPRSRAKVRAWFRRQSETDNRSAGRAILERELARLGTGLDRLATLVPELRVRDAAELCLRLGEGEISATQLSQTIERMIAPRTGLPIRRPRASQAVRRASPVAVEGVGDLPITIARCCAPMRPQPIGGYVTLGRGVTIHRVDCPGFVRMQALKPQRVLQAEWAGSEAGTLSVDVTIQAYDRRGLVRDVSDVLAAERVPIEAMNTTTDRREGTATIVLQLGVRDVDQLDRLLRRLALVPSALGARRTR